MQIDHINKHFFNRNNFEQAMLNWLIDEPELLVNMDGIWSIEPITKCIKKPENTECSPV